MTTLSKKQFAKAATGKKNIKLYSTPDEKMRLEFTDLTLEVPSGDETLIRGMDMVVEQGQKVAFVGPNGSGKSSLFRVLRGLWNFGEGNIEITAPEGVDILCASQRSRMPDTTLDGILAYPLVDASTFTHEQYEDVLKEVGLENLIRQLPWNAKKPQNVLRVCDNIIERLAKMVTNELSPRQIPAFTRGLQASMERYFKFPYQIEDTITSEEKRAIAAAVAERVKQLTSENAQGKGDRWFPNSRGKKTGKKLAVHASLLMKRWLMTGNNMSLSGGQEQMLIFGRIFLQKPDVLLLDEITSALKEDMADKLYGKMVKDLPDSIVVSIVHNEHLLKHHTHVMELQEKQIDKMSFARFQEKPKLQP